MSTPEAFAAHLRQHGSEATRAATIIITEVGIEIAQVGSEKAPYDTGELGFSINSKTTGSVNPTATITSDTDYGGYVEFGTSSQAPQPYLNPALDERAPSAETRLAQISASL